MFWPPPKHGGPCGWRKWFQPVCVPSSLKQPAYCAPVIDKTTRLSALERFFFPHLSINGLNPRSRRLTRTFGRQLPSCSLLENPGSWADPEFKELLPKLLEDILSQTWEGGKPRTVTPAGAGPVCWTVQVWLFCLL